MASFSDIATSLRVPTQLPLDHKRFAVSELALSNLGDADNLAFTYYDNLKVFCWNEKSEFVWREVKTGEEDTGLVPSDFTYPNGVVYPNPGYEGKKYNFFRITPGTDTKIQAGTSISITGNGSVNSPYIINSNFVFNPPASDIPPLQTIDEGNGNGIIRRGRNAANFGNVGFNAVDLSTNGTASNFAGACGESSFAVGNNITIGSGFNSLMGENLSSTGSSTHSLVVGKGTNWAASFGFSYGTNNTSVGKGNFVGGIDNNGQGTSMTILGQAATIQTHSTTDYNAAPTRPLLLIGNGNVDNITNLATFRNDAFIVRKNGIVEAPSMAIADITAGVARTLATKEYVTTAINKTYKEYVAVLTQTGVNAPTMTGGAPFVNELGGTIVWSYSGVGIYAGTLTGAFTVGKTVIFINGFMSSTNNLMRAFSNSVNSVNINTFSSGVGADSILNNAGITIRVYN